MRDFSKIIDAYAAFERKVQAAVRELCKPYCGVCKGVCCHPDYCRETLESPFLSLLHRQYPPAAGYSEKDGWLTESGCALKVGRAPVCYEFLCDRIIDADIRPSARYLLAVVSQLVTHAGRFAPGRRHVVELTQMAELQKLTFHRFQKRLTESQNAFAVIHAFLENRPLPANASSVLAVIVKPATRRLFPGDSDGVSIV